MGRSRGSDEMEFAASRMRAAKQAANAGNAKQARQILDHAIAETVNVSYQGALRGLRKKLR